MDDANELTIRSCSAGEAVAVIELLSRCGLLFAPTDRPELIRAKLERDPDSVLVLTDGQAIIGCIMFLYDPMYSVLLHLAVDPTSRRRGYGARLIEAARRRVAERGGAMTVGAYVVASNEASLALVRSSGFDTYDQPITFVFSTPA